jgi:hypothetical protein
MFSGCTNLKTVIFGNFEATALRGMNSMFKGCTSLIYLQIFILPEREYPNPRITITGVFSGINPFARYCINDSYTKDYLLRENAIYICSDTCMDESNIKVDLVDNKCVETCPNGRFVYKNTSICYGDCPHNSYPIFCDENECDDSIRECFDETPENYYFDNSSQNYKKCYESCKYCYGEGNESNQNCKECKSDLIFYNNLLNISNCYEICNDYYYFDESNEFHCSESCPEEYKLIIENKKCIADCKNDDIYIFEYNNICYPQCPNGTYILEDEGDNKCYEYHKDGYYLDLDKQLFKKCFETCSKCNKGGNITNNNCLECKPNYIAYNNSIGITNCYEICDKYFYIDEFEIYNCISNCPIKYNK